MSYISPMYKSRKNETLCTNSVHSTISKNMYLTVKAICLVYASPRASKNSVFIDRSDIAPFSFIAIAKYCRNLSHSSRTILSSDSVLISSKLKISRNKVKMPQPAMFVSFYNRNSSVLILFMRYFNINIA